MEKKLPKLNHFIAYEGTEEAVKAFYARAICRRAERVVVRLLDSQTSPCPLRSLSRAKSREGEGDDIKKYLNRLSDVLFVLGRWMNKR
jgi:cob(I)alamin adenosyltransferase